MILHVIYLHILAADDDVWNLPNDDDDDVWKYTSDLATWYHEQRQVTSYLVGQPVPRLSWYHEQRQITSYLVGQPVSYRVQLGHAHIVSASLRAYTKHTRVFEYFS